VVFRTRTPRRGVPTVTRAAFFSLCVLAAVTNGFAAEPRNLDLLKRELRAYHDSGAYDREIAKIVGEARLWIEQRVARRKTEERLAIVFDFDETLVSNWPSFRAGDFGYVEEKWLAWVEAAEAPPISPVVDLLKFARTHGLSIFVITSRTESQRVPTSKNLERIGCVENVRLICAPDDWRETAAKFKTAQRQQLAKNGYTILANIGDQQSDLVGGNAERTFKLPNPFYLTE
jgi:acid phosphatase